MWFVIQFCFAKLCSEHLYWIDESPRMLISETLKNQYSTDFAKTAKLYKASNDASNLGGELIL